MEVRVRRLRGLKTAGFPKSFSAAEKPPARRCPAICLFFLLLGTLIVACQTPPKKTTTARNARSSHASGGDAAHADTLELLALSAERFGSDPRVSRPVLVSDTVWIVVAGAVVLVSGAAFVSAAKSGRAGRSSRHRT